MPPRVRGCEGARPALEMRCGLLCSDVPRSIGARNAAEFDREFDEAMKRAVKKFEQLDRVRYSVCGQSASSPRGCKLCSVSALDFARLRRAAAV